MIKRTPQTVRWETKSSSEMYRSPYARVYDDVVNIPGNKTITYTRIQLNDFVTVVPLLKNKIVMVQVYRYPLNDWSLEVPTGHIESSESPEITALRELEEEAGYRAKKIRKIGWFYPLTRSTQKSELFVAEQLEKVEPHHDETEQIRIRLLSTRKVLELVTTGKINHAPTIIALLKLFASSPFYILNSDL